MRCQRAKTGGICYTTGALIRSDIPTVLYVVDFAVALVVSRWWVGGWVQGEAARICSVPVSLKKKKKKKMMKRWSLLLTADDSLFFFFFLFFVAKKRKGESTTSCTEHCYLRRSTRRFSSSSPFFRLTRAGQRLNPFIHTLPSRLHSPCHKLFLKLKLLCTSSSSS